ncbi:hypothetical protein K435DRAFT_863434 [Dendrothele bispora CBS 962.96]|uniref:Uncharacterized protein n=1 Tax=Dendrothele bispora (strain CBS 962.96) TaxID=1314807 RepID=A0A4S8LPU0_DENBC|nr:hypothetical protein K435DRAFT_863434 [Dendrothele bispora CBS 962.96]
MPLSSSSPTVKSPHSLCRRRHRQSTARAASRTGDLSTALTQGHSGSTPALPTKEPSRGHLSLPLQVVVVSSGDDKKPAEPAREVTRPRRSQTLILDSLRTCWSKSRVRVTAPRFSVHCGARRRRRRRAGPDLQAAPTSASTSGAEKLGSVFYARAVSRTGDLSTALTQVHSGSTPALLTKEPSRGHLSLPLQVVVVSRGHLSLPLQVVVVSRGHLSLPLQVVVISRGHLSLPLQVVVVSSGDDKKPAEPAREVTRPRRSQTLILGSLRTCWSKNGVRVTAHCFSVHCGALRRRRQRAGPDLQAAPTSASTSGAEKLGSESFEALHDEQQPVAEKRVGGVSRVWEHAGELGSAESPLERAELVVVVARVELRA